MVLLRYLPFHLPIIWIYFLFKQDLELVQLEMFLLPKKYLIFLELLIFLRIYMRLLIDH